MHIPAISVLLPARDSEPFIREAVESVRAQTFSDFEIIAVDDRSTDRTGAVLAELAATEPRLRVVPGPGEGIAAALNAGLAHCRAPFVARMDADDVALSLRFERQLAAIERDRRLAAVGSRVEIFPRDEMTAGLWSYEAWLNGLTEPAQIRRECLVESPLVHPAALIRREALRAVGGWQARGWPEDYGLWLELLGAGWELANVPEVLLRWRDHAARLTRTHPDYAPDAFVRLKAQYLKRFVLREPRCWMWGAAKTGRAFFHELRRLGVSVEKFVDIDPKLVGRTLHGSAIVSPDQLGGFEGVHLVAAVGAKGARALIREHLQKRGWKEVEQFSCVG